MQRRRLEPVLKTLMEPPFFPVPLDIMQACLAFHDFEAGRRLGLPGGIEVRTAPLSHPGGATGYRVEYRGRSVCYVTDTEHPERGRDEAILELIEGSDLYLRRYLHRRGVRPLPRLGPLHLAGGRAAVRGRGRRA